MSSGLIAYLITVGTLGLVAFWRTGRWLRLRTLARTTRLRSRRRMEALSPHEPNEEVERERRERSLEAIAKQFTVTRLLVLPLIGAATVFAMALPLLPQVPAASLSVVVAVITVMLGIASKPLLENAMAGLVISYSKMINLGDTVLIDGHYGTIEDISPTHTTLKIWDWRRMVVPNARMLATDVISYSLHDRFVWASVEFYVAQGTDLDQLESHLVALPRDSGYWLVDTDVELWVMEIERDAIRCCLAAWADSPANAWYLRHEMRVGINRTLTALGVLPHLGRLTLTNEPPREVSAGGPPARLNRS